MSEILKGREARWFRTSRFQTATWARVTNRGTWSRSFAEVI